MTLVYAGPRRSAREAELLAYQRRGWVLDEKLDGVYAELHVGRCPCCDRSAITVGRLRSGELATLEQVRRAPAHRFRHVVGLHVPWTAGTVVVGELHVQTPAAFRWRDAHGGVAGCTMFDVLATGTADDLPGAAVRAAQAAQAAGGLPRRDWTREPFAERRRELEGLVAELRGPAARTLFVARQWTAGLRNRYRELVEAGEEGGVLRDPAAPVGRGIVKVKRSDTVTARVVAVEEGRVRLDWGGQTFAVATPSAFELAVGDLVDVAAIGFEERGIPRHARAVRRRDDLRA